MKTLSVGLCVMLLLPLGCRTVGFGQVRNVRNGAYGASTLPWGGEYYRVGVQAVDGALSASRETRTATKADGICHKPGQWTTCAAQITTDSIVLQGRLREKVARADGAARRAQRKLRGCEDKLAVHSQPVVVPAVEVTWTEVALWAAGGLVVGAVGTAYVASRVTASE